MLDDVGTSAYVGPNLKSKDVGSAKPLNSTVATILVSG